MIRMHATCAVTRSIEKRRGPAAGSQLLAADQVRKLVQIRSSAELMRTVISGHDIGKCMVAGQRLGVST